MAETGIATEEMFIIFAGP